MSEDQPQRRPWCRISSCCNDGCFRVVIGIHGDKDIARVSRCGKCLKVVGDIVLFSGTGYFFDLAKLRTWIETHRSDTIMPGELGHLTSALVPSKKDQSTGPNDFEETPF